MMASGRTAGQGRTVAAWETPDGAARLAALRAACEAVGVTAESQLVWVVDFTRQDPKKWHPGTRAATGDALVVLGRAWTANQVADANGQIPSPLEAHEVEEIHGTLRTLLQSLVANPAGARTEIPSDGLTLAVVRTPEGGFLPSYSARTALVAVGKVVMDLVLAVDRGFRACPKCGTPFVKIRKQLYCSKPCAQDVRNERKAKALQRQRRPRKKVTR